MMFSIVIPVYNCERYLRDCLESICTQTYTDWECICVDDGSNDRSPSILDEYAERNPRFRIIHKKNEGVSAARNDALDKARGDWIVFVDSDDTLKAETLSIISLHLDSSRMDALAFGWQKVKSGIVEEKSQGDHHSLVEGDVLKYLLDNSLDWVTWTVWGKAWNRSAIERLHLRFVPEIRCCEDVLFSVSFLAQISSLGLELDYRLYDYRISESQTTAHVTTDMILQQIECVKVLSELNSHHPCLGLEKHLRNSVELLIRAPQVQLQLKNRVAYYSSLLQESGRRNSIAHYLKSSTSWKMRTISFCVKLIDYRVMSVFLALI